MRTRYFWLSFVAGFMLAACTSYIILKPFIFPESDIDVFRIEYSSLSGKSFTLHKRSEKIRLISYWATWCKPCVAEFKDFQKLKEQYGDKLEIIAVSDEEAGIIKNFKNRHNYDFQYMRASQKLSNYDIYAIPVNVILDSDGNAIYSKIGQLAAGELEEILNQ